MERDLHSPDTYDYRQYDRIWQRVAPTLEPYPDFQSGSSPAVADLGRPAVPAVAEAQLPGAEADPCCMGTAAAEMLEVIQGFIEAELSDRRYYQAMARQAPSSARQKLRDLAAEAAAAARQLLAVHYLITGTCYQPAIDCGRVQVGSWCGALRERYHVEACNGMNYLRAAEGTADPCLVRLLTELSDRAFRNSRQVLALLERAL